MTEQVIVRTIARFMIPFILLFGLYVIFHGEGGPGGGFQGGVILGAGVALYGIVWGRDAARRGLPAPLWDALCGLGVFVYAGIGVLCIVLGGNLLQYDAMQPWFSESGAHTPVQSANHWGVFGVEMGVAITVTAVMITLFFEISRPRDDQGDAS